MSRIMIAGTNSGCGKTTITCGLLKAFTDRNMKVASFKCGPDYIDPMFHSKMIGTKSRNLDSYMCDSICDIILENSLDIDVIEGVMGYFDGGEGSSANIAALTGTKVIMVIDCKGMSESIEAIISGFICMDKAKCIAGFIFNRLPESVESSVKEMCDRLGTVYLGRMPENKYISIGSRHLGLITADEISDIKEKLSLIKDLCEKYIDIDSIIKIANTASKLEPTGKVIEKQVEGIKIAVSRDEAFSFMYEDNLDVLKKMGCEIEFFSPIKDKHLPACADGIILCGGYPELYASELSKNTSMLEDIRNAYENGIPMIAECGGFLYLHSELQVEEDGETKNYKMANIINGLAYKTSKLKRFGYHEMMLEKDGLLGTKGEMIRVHEFHYYDSDALGEDIRLTKRNKNISFLSGYHTDTFYAGFSHLHFRGNEQPVIKFVKKCESVKSGKKCDEDYTYENIVKKLILQIECADEKSKELARKHWNGVAKPLHSMGKFEGIVEKLAGIFKDEYVDIKKRASVVFCSDNGVVCEKVTQTGSEVTALVANAMVKGDGNINNLSNLYGADVHVIDMGIVGDNVDKRVCNLKIANGTNNIKIGPAMTRAQAYKAVYTGINLVKHYKDMGYKILITGEMGIGNTTTSSAIASVILDENVENVTGRGAGLDDNSLARKIEVIKEAIAVNKPDSKDAFDILSKLGGYDIAGMMGLFIGGAVYGVPVVIDGVISSVAAALAYIANKKVKEYMIASHASKESACSKMLEYIGLEPVIMADMCLGEGTGAVMMLPLIDGALAIYNSNHSFDGLGMDSYEEF